MTAPKYGFRSRSDNDGECEEQSLYSFLSNAHINLFNDFMGAVCCAQLVVVNDNLHCRVDMFARVSRQWPTSDLLDNDKHDYWMHTGVGFESSKLVPRPIGLMMSEPTVVPHCESRGCKHVGNEPNAVCHSLRSRGRSRPMPEPVCVNDLRQLISEFTL